MPSDEVLGLSVSVRRANFDQQIEEMAVKELADSAAYIEYLNDILEFVRKKKEASGRQSGLMPVQPNQYKTFTAKRALEEYMRARIGIHIPLDRIVKDLVLGGAYEGKPRPNQTDKHGLIARIVRTTLANNQQMYDFDKKKTNPETDFVTVDPDAPNEEVMVWMKEGQHPPQSRKRKN